MNLLLLVTQRRPIVKDIVYWVIFIIFWTLLWGLSDYQFSRNIVIQISSLPARMMLVYISIYYLFPRFFKRQQYLTFLAFYGLLLLAIVMVIQRPLMLYYIQPRFLPFWNNSIFFSSSEIINTALDVNIAAIVPIGYKIITALSHQPEQADMSVQDNMISNLRCAPYIEVHIEKLVHKITTQNIVFIESQRNHVRIQLRNEELVVRETISSFKEKLYGENFAQVHRSFLVNLDEISNTTARKIMCGKYIIPVGRMYQKAIQKKLSSTNFSRQGGSARIN